MGLKVFLEKGYGKDLGYSDEEYKNKGTEFLNSSDEVYSKSDLICKVNLPAQEEINLLKQNTNLIVSNYNPDKEKNLIKKDLNVFALNLLPRITRAQSMDVLSSQANLAGYRAVIESIYEYEKAVPMMMTAAGTVPAARVLVVGAGVAGLQAIATAKRLGAIVSATDVRLAAKEQVESLGGKFIMVESDELKDAETSGGYAKEMSKEFKIKQAELISQTLSSQDIIICTALIPGKKAPILISENQVKSMKPGSIIIDLASESGGNCECSIAGEIININGVLVSGSKNITSEIAQDASALFAKNLFNFFKILIDNETNEINIDWEDEIIIGTALTKNGEIIHEGFIK